MPLFTGTDSNGVAATGHSESWYTLMGDTVSNHGVAFDFRNFSYGFYTIMGNVLSDDDAISSDPDTVGDTVTVTSTGILSGLSDAIELFGASHKVVNNGEIYAYGDAGIQFVRDGTEATNGRIVNNGMVQSFNRGVVMGEGDVLTNTGQIFGTNSGIEFKAGGNSVTNYGEILSDFVAIRIDMFVSGGGANTIVNHGTISASGAGTGGRAISVSGPSQQVEVVNHGEINGDVFFWLGDDIFDAQNGTLNGTLTGGWGDDTLIMQQSNPGALMEFDGGNDSDTLDLSQFVSAVWVGLDYAGVEAWTKDDMTLTTGGWRTIADLMNVENVIGSIGIDYMAGNEADNLLGYVGSKLVDGIDRMFGGDGQDTADFSRFDSGVWINLSATGPTAWTQDDANATDGPTVDNPWRQIAQLKSIENLVGTKAVDYMHGDSGDNVFGYVGTSDHPGIELIDGKGGTDTVDFSRFDSAVWVDLNFGPIEAYTQDDDYAYDAVGLYRKIADLTSIENVTGTNDSDYIKGTNGANVINGHGGFDLMAGRGGADTFIFSTADTAGGGTTIEDFEANDAEKIDLSGVIEIIDFNDLVNNHLSDMGGVATIHNGEGLTITLMGWTAANFGAGNPISDADFIF